MKNAIMFKRALPKRDGWCWEVEIYEDEKQIDARCFHYYSGKGCIEAIDYARAWDKNWTLNLGKY